MTLGFANISSVARNLFGYSGGSEVENTSFGKKIGMKQYWQSGSHFSEEHFAFDSRLLFTESSTSDAESHAHESCLSVPKEKAPGFKQSKAAKVTRSDVKSFPNVMPIEC